MVGRSKIAWIKTRRLLRIPARSSPAPTPTPPVTFDPTTLPWRLAIRGPYSGVPWNGIATAGPSAGNFLGDSATDPTVGAPLNGFAPADCDGSQYLLGYTPGPTRMLFSDIIAASAYYVAALVYIRSAPAPAPAPYLNPCIIADDGGAMGLAVSSAGVKGFHDDAGTYVETAWAPLSLNAWHFVEWWFDGSNIHIAVDGVAGAPSGATASASYETLEHVIVGANYAGIGIDGLLEELWAIDTDESAHSADMISYENARYGLSL